MSNTIALIKKKKLRLQWEVKVYLVFVNVNGYEKKITGMKVFFLYFLPSFLFIF